MAIAAVKIPVTRATIFGVAFALLAAIGFSGKAILVKLAYLDQVDAVTLLAMRMAFSLPFFVGVALWARRNHALPLNWRERMQVLALGLIGFYCSSFLDMVGLQYISAGLERLILFLYPTMTVLLSAMIYRVAIGKRTYIAMAVCYAGIVLVFMNDAGMRQGGSIILGASLIFAATLSYSVYLVGAGHVIGRIGAARFTAYAMIVASTASFLQFLLTHPLSALELPLRVYELSAAMAVFSTVMPVFLLSWAIHRIGPGSASMIGAIGPVSTIYMAHVFLNENMSLLQIAGSALVLAGVIMVSLVRLNEPGIR